MTLTFFIWAPPGVQQSHVGNFKSAFLGIFASAVTRYERRSLIITSNLLFSEWDRIFQNPLTTAAAIDRVVHHSIILEFGADMISHRAEAAAHRQKATNSSSLVARSIRADQEVPINN